METVFWFFIISFVRVFNGNCILFLFFLRKNHLFGKSMQIENIFQKKIGCREIVLTLLFLDYGFFGVINQILETFGGHRDEPAAVVSNLWCNYFQSDSKRQQHIWDIIGDLVVAIDQCRMLRNGFGEHTDYSDDDFRIVRGSGWPPLINMSRGHVRRLPPSVVTSVYCFYFGFRLGEYFPRRTGGGVPHRQKYRVIHPRFVRFSSIPATSQNMNSQLQKQKS